MLLKFEILARILKISLPIDWLQGFAAIAVGLLIYRNAALAWMKIEEKTKILTKLVSLSVFRFLHLVITAIAFYELNFQLTANNLGSKSIEKRRLNEDYQNPNEVVMQTLYDCHCKHALSSDNLSEENFHAL